MSHSIKYIAIYPVLLSAMSFLISLKVITLYYEPLWTLRAAKMFFFGVCHPVPFQLVKANKALATENPAVNKWSFISVPA